MVSLEAGVYDTIFCYKCFVQTNRKQKQLIACFVRTIDEGLSPCLPTKDCVTPCPASDQLKSAGFDIKLIENGTSNMWHWWQKL